MINTHCPKIPPLVALAIALCLPSLGSAQVLLSAANYALLGGTAISVGGPGPNPIVNGNVGLSSSATSNITGLLPAVVSGSISCDTALGNHPLLAPAAPRA